MALETEIETYKRALPTLIKSEGKYALVIGDKLVDVFETYDDALREGYRLRELEPFLVKQVHLVEQVQFISREIDAPCHT